MSVDRSQRYINSNCVFIYTTALNFSANNYSKYAEKNSLYKYNAIRIPFGKWPKSVGSALHCMFISIKVTA